MINFSIVQVYVSRIVSYSNLLARHSRYLTAYNPSFFITYNYRRASTKSINYCKNHIGFWYIPMGEANCLHSQLAEPSRVSHPCRSYRNCCHTDKKKSKFFSHLWKFRWDRVESHTYMRKGFLIYEEMRKYKKAFSHICMIPDPS
jgi:hypothetical protein